MSRSVAVLLILAVTLCACAGTDGGGSSGARPGVVVAADDYGGSVSLTIRPDSHSFSGRFLTDQTTIDDSATFGIEAEDECVTSGGPVGFFANFVPLDVGNQIVAVSEEDASSSFSAEKVVYPGGDIQYEDTDNDPGFSGDYVLSVEGSTEYPAGEIGVIAVPEAVEIDPDGPIVPGEPWTIEFTRDVDATAVEFTVHGNITVYCNVRADGSATLPADLTLQLGSPSYIDSVSAVTATTVPLGSRELLLVGRWRE